MGTTIQIYGTMPGGGGNLQDKTATPSAQEQVIAPDAGYDGLSSVTVSGDADLIAENIKKDVEIFGVTGTLDATDISDYGALGSEIDVEAETAITKGSKIIGRLNDDYVQPTRTYEAHNIDKVIAVSEDMSVIITDNQGKATVNSVENGYQWNFYFLDEQTGLYGNMYTVTLENYPEEYKCNNIPVLNESGTLAVVASYFPATINSETFRTLTIVFEIDKTNHSVTYRYVYLPNTQLLPDLVYNHDTYTKLETISLYGNLNNASSGAGLHYIFGGVLGNYIFAKCHCVTYKSEDDRAVSYSRKTLVILKYENGAYTIYHYLQLGSEQWGLLPTGNNDNLVNFSYINDNDVMFSNYNGSSLVSKLFKFDMQNKVLVASSVSIPQYFNLFSKNYKYTARVTKEANNKYTVYLYETNYSDLTLTNIKTFQFTSISPVNSNDGSGYSSCSNDGRYVILSNSYILDMEDEVSYGFGVTGQQILMTMGFNINKFITRNYIQAIVPGTEAEYIVRTYTSSDHTTNDVIYGVASQDLAVGTRGEARAITTLQSKSIEVTENGTTTITPDTGFDALSSVEVDVGITSRYNAKIGSGENKETYDSVIALITEVDMSGVQLLNVTNLFNGFKRLETVLNLDISNYTSVINMFTGCASLVTLPSMDTSNITKFTSFCSTCTSLQNVPVLNMQSVNSSYIDSMFYNCSSLTNASLNNILESLLTGNISGSNHKTLAHIGLSQTQAETCTTLSNWAALEAAGWVTGY